MPQSPLHPHLVVADAQGNIYDHPQLLMVCRRGGQWGLPRPDECIPLPRESELFLLPGRCAVGLDPESGVTEVQEDLAVAAFPAPAYTLTAHPAYVSDADAPLLPLFAYGAVGYARGRFYICARKVDDDPRQEFRGVNRKALEARVRALVTQYPQNRLMQHIMKACLLRYDCPAARNLALGRHEAPLPTSRSCNARCVGCISQQEADSPLCATPQCRLNFCPTPEEVVEVMLHHADQAIAHPIYSFGQGCEGEPLTEADLLIASVRAFRAAGGRGTVNLNSNASRPDVVAALADAGLTSLRVSMNSARENVYTRYYRPQGYTLEDVRESMRRARCAGVFVSINLLYFPGVSDTEEEIDALTELVGSAGVSFLQLRNLNIDPEWYLRLLDGVPMGPTVGFTNFRKRLRKSCPWLKFGYFNPWLGDRATLTSPWPGEWALPSPADTPWAEEDNLDDDSFVSEAENDGPPDEACGSCEDPTDNP